MSKNQTNRREKHQNFCLWIPYKGGVSWSMLAKEKWWIVMPERRYHLPIICSIFHSYWDIILMFFYMIWLLSWDCQWSAIQAVEDICPWGWPRPMALFTQITGKFTGLSDFIPRRLDLYHCLQAGMLHSQYFLKLPEPVHTITPLCDTPGFRQAQTWSCWCSSLPFTREQSESTA